VAEGWQAIAAAAVADLALGRGAERGFDRKERSAVLPQAV